MLQMPEISRPLSVTSYPEVPSLGKTNAFFFSSLFVRGSGVVLRVCCARLSSPGSAGV